MQATTRVILSAAALLAAVAETAATQEVKRVHPGWGGLYAMVSPASGASGRHLGLGIGAGLYAVPCMDPYRILGLRVEFSVTGMGGPERRVRYSSPGAPDAYRIEDYSSGIITLSAGPQLTLPTPFVRPYLMGQVGLSYVFTTSESRWEDEDPSESDGSEWSLGPNEFNLPLSIGGGLLIQLSRGPKVAWLDLSAQWMHQGKTTFVSDRSAVEWPQGTMIRPVTSVMSLWQFRVGIVMSE